MNQVFEIRDEYIELVKLLKASGLCSTGGSNGGLRLSAGERPQGLAAMGTEPLRRVSDPRAARADQNYRRGQGLSGLHPTGRHRWFSPGAQRVELGRGPQLVSRMAVVIAGLRASLRYSLRALTSLLWGWLTASLKRSGWLVEFPSLSGLLQRA